MSALIRPDILKETSVRDAINTPIIIGINDK